MPEQDRLRDSKVMQWAMAEIASQAFLAKDLCTEAVANSDSESRELQTSLIASVRSLIIHIGWIADRHAGHELVGDAADWLMSPAYKQALGDESIEEDRVT